MKQLQYSVYIPIIAIQPKHQNLAALLLGIGFCYGNLDGPALWPVHRRFDHELPDPCHSGRGPSRGCSKLTTSIM